MNYFATVLPGLEDLFIQEIKHRCFETMITKANRGKVFFTSILDVEDLKRLANNLYYVITELEVGLHRQHLQQWCNQVFHINLKPFLRITYLPIGSSRRCNGRNKKTLPSQKNEYELSA
ncbi:hypothetical protein [Shimazuella alba]|uniref:Uncharacterized protein n=1 Tax=Shimazuella alba TaxID=2690964 RepID=A0A6I4W2C3_9BACL|nr:hypothetical protein [Shimazuella alba]MXQ54924.1 hypothetical protein [Shimazuella alba]